MYAIISTHRPCAPAAYSQDGKVTGATQKASGKVNMTLQVVNAARVTTSFNFVGLMNAAGVLAGTFSGCEISRAAGSVSGSFKMMVRNAIRGGIESGERRRPLGVQCLCPTLRGGARALVARAPLTRSLAPSPPTSSLPRSA